MQGLRPVNAPGSMTTLFSALRVHAGGARPVSPDAGPRAARVSLGRSLALVVPWFALGFALHAVACAAQQQDANSAGQPVTYILLAAFFVGYAAVTADAERAIAHILTVFPSRRRSSCQHGAQRGVYFGNDLIQLRSCQHWPQSCEAPKG